MKHKWFFKMCVVEVWINVRFNFFNYYLMIYCQIGILYFNLKNMSWYVCKYESGVAKFCFGEGSEACKC